MSTLSVYTWPYFAAATILCASRWSLYSLLSYRHIEALILQRGLRVDHTTVLHWIQS